FQLANARRVRRVAPHGADAPAVMPPLDAGAVAHAPAALPAQAARRFLQSLFFGFFPKARIVLRPQVDLIPHQTHTPALIDVLRVSCPYTPIMRPGWLTTPFPDPKKT